MGRDGRRSRWVGCVLAAAVLLASCSGGAGQPPLEEALADRDDLVEATSALFGAEGQGVPTGDDRQWRAEQVAERIAESIEALEPSLDPAAVARYEETIGTAPADQVRHVAAVLGHTRAVLAPGVEDEERMAYALRMAWTLADRFASGDERLGWVVTEAIPIGPDDRDELIGHLDGGDDTAAAQLAVDLWDGGPGVVVDAVEVELSELVPVDPDEDLLTTLHTVYGTTSSADG